VHKRLAQRWEEVLGNKTILKFQEHKAGMLLIQGCDIMMSYIA
jgi:hypothetical protein